MPLNISSNCTKSRYRSRNKLRAEELLDREKCNELSPHFSSVISPQTYPPLAVTVNRACQMIGVGRTSLYELISAAKLRPARIAGRTLIAVSQLQALVASAA